MYRFFLAFVLALLGCYAAPVDIAVPRGASVASLDEREICQADCETRVGGVDAKNIGANGESCDHCFRGLLAGETDAAYLARTKPREVIVSEEYAAARIVYWLCTAVRFDLAKKRNYRISTRIPLDASLTDAAAQAEAVSIASAQWKRFYPDDIVGAPQCSKPAVDRGQLGRIPAQPPQPLPPATAPKPTSRIWSCRVKLRWHVGARHGDVDETWSDIEAPSESTAMGLAIQRSQSRLKALSLAGTNPTWSKTEVKCT